MESKTGDNMRIEKTPEQKAAERNAKKLEKAMRKEKSMNKPTEKEDKSNKSNEEKKKPDCDKFASAKTKQISQKNNESNINSTCQIKSSAESKPLIVTKKSETKSLHINNSKLKLRKEIKKKWIWYENVPYYDRTVDYIKNISASPECVIHPSFLEFGRLLDSRELDGSTERCEQFLGALRQFTADMSLTSNEVFSLKFTKDFERQVFFLGQCRQLCASVRAAIDFVNSNLLNTGNDDNDECKMHLLKLIDQFVKERFEMAHRTIVTLAKRYVQPGDQILTYGNCDLVLQVLTTATGTGSHQPIVVHVVDSWPHTDSGSFVTRLAQQHKYLDVRCLPLHMVPSVMRKIDCVLLGTHSLHHADESSDGVAVALSGSADIALMAHNYRKPVLVCAETLKFSPEACSVYSDQLAYTDGLLTDDSVQHDNYHLLLPYYDIIPARHISHVVCEIGIIAPSAIGYVTRTKQT